MAEDEIERDVGGVQGTAEDETADAAGDAAGEAGPVDAGTKVIAPDSGEIEWAGELVKKAPGTPDS